MFGKYMYFSKNNYEFTESVFSGSITAYKPLAEETRGSPRKELAKRQKETCSLILVEYDRKSRWCKIKVSQPNLESARQ
jgi:hypothetical protein